MGESSVSKSEAGKLEERPFSVEQGGKWQESLRAHLSVVQPVLDLVHFAALDRVHHVKVLHDNGYVTDDVTKHGRPNDHAHDRKPPLEVVGAGDVPVSDGCPEKRPRGESTIIVRTVFVLALVFYLVYSTLRILVIL